MQYANENTTEYLVRFQNSQKVNEACNGSIITRVVQYHGMNIIFPFHTTVFYLIQENDNKEAEKTGEELLCAILYFENLDKATFVDLNNRVENDNLFFPYYLRYYKEAYGDIHSPKTAMKLIWRIFYFSDVLIFTS